MDEDVKTMRDHIIRQEAKLKIIAEQHSMMRYGVMFALQDLHVQLAKPGMQTERGAATRLRMLIDQFDETRRQVLGGTFVADLADLLEQEFRLPADLIDEPPKGTA